MYEIVNKQVKFLTTQCIGTFASAYTKGYELSTNTSQYVGTCKSAYTKGYALN